MCPKHVQTIYLYYLDRLICLKVEMIIITLWHMQLTRSWYRKSIPKIQFNILAFRAICSASFKIGVYNLVYAASIRLFSSWCVSVFFFIPKLIALHFVRPSVQTSKQMNTLEEEINMWCIKWSLILHG